MLLYCVGNILLELSREKKISSVLFVNAHFVSMGISLTADQLPPSYNVVQIKCVSGNFCQLGLMSLIGF